MDDLHCGVPPETESRSPISTARRVALGALGAGALLVAFLAGRARWLELPVLGGSHVEVRPTPNVIVAVRDLARLETTTYHMERVIELSDQQTKLFGLVEAKDAILLVAVGDVVGGIDLQKLADGDVETDWPARRVKIRLPAPEIFASILDNTRTHVVSRATDTLASRREELEGKARAEAEGSMRRAALEGGILDRARTAGERTLRELLKSLGFEVIELTVR